MNDPAKFNNVISFLWAFADLLKGAFKKSVFHKIILPFTVLRRLNYALELTEAKVLSTEHTLKEKGLKNRHRQLCHAAGYAFYNTNKFNYESLLHDDANLALNLRQYLIGFSPNVREIQPSNFATYPQIPVCLWFLAKNNNADAKRCFRDCRK